MLNYFNEEHQAQLEQKYGPWYLYLSDNNEYNNRFILRFAEIYPRYNQDHNPKIKFRIVVPQGKEGIIPHLHMYFRNIHDRSHKYVSYICLHKAEYSSHHKDGKFLTNREREEFVRFMKTHIPKIHNDEVKSLTCWQECVRLWILSHGDHKMFKRDIDGNYAMPDYSELE